MQRFGRPAGLARGGVFTAGLPMREAWLRVREVAAQLRVSTAMVYRLIERGELTHVRVSNAIRISPAELAAYFEKNP